jgi:peptide/nickel transport system substrate-binding protein
MARTQSSRRAFLQRAAVLVAGAPLLGLLGSQPASASVVPAGGPALRAGTGSLTVALPADPAGLNPLLQTGLVEASVQANVFDSLAFLDADGTPQAALAQSWEVLNDRTWEFRLRPGVAFHDGEPFDSAAVRSTVETMLDSASGSPVRAQLSAIESVETPDPLTARIVTRQPFAPLLSELTALAILPPKLLASAGMTGLDAAPVGTGPFRFVEWMRDERIVLEANRDHWRGAPGLDRVVFQPIPEGATRLAALRTGEIGLATNVSSDQASTVARNGLRLLSRPGIQTLYLRDP